MPRSLGPALLATLTASGCYVGLDETDDTSESSSTATTAEPTDGGPTADDDDSLHEPGSTDVSITVVDRHGTPIAGARVHHSIADFDDMPTPPEPHVHVTDATGHLVLTGFRGDRQAIRVDADGWLSATAVVELVPDRSMEARVTLLRRDPTDPAVFKQFDASKGAEALAFADGAVVVSIPPGALVDTEGVQVSGPVAVSVVPIDTLSAPGPLRAIDDENGAYIPLRTLFMADVSVWQGDQELQLNNDPAFDATIRYRLPASASAYNDIPAWYFDLDEGHWIEDTTALTTIDDGYWTATVSHFTPWNADVTIMEMGCVTVTACIDANCNKKAPYTPVTAEGPGYIVTRITDETGVTCLEVPKHTVADDPNDPNYPLNRVYLGLPGDPDSVAQELPLTENASCGPPVAGCKELSFKISPVCNGGVQECVYEGPPATIDIGQCSPPIRVCDGGVWGLCEGGHSPPANQFDDDCPPDEALNDPLDAAMIQQYDKDCDGLLEPEIGCPCTLTFDYPCYDYPAEFHLEEENICKAGTIECQMGNPAPKCDGTVDPGVLVEIPNNGTDDDCDGSTTTFDLPQMAARLYIGNPDDLHDQTVWDVVADTNYVYITGNFQHSLELFGCSLNSGNGGAEDMFVARLNANDLKCDRAFQFTISDTPADPMRIARAANGEIAVLSTCGGTTNEVLDVIPNITTDLTGCSEDPTVFVAFFDANFAYLKNQVLGIDSENSSLHYVDARALASHPTKGFLVAGGFTKAEHGLTYTSVGSEDLFVASFTTAGDFGNFYPLGPLTAKKTAAWSTAIAVDPMTDEIVLAGSFNDGLYINLDEPTIPGDGAFVARFTADLALLSSLQLAVTQQLDPTSVAIAKTGPIYVGGTFTDNLTITDANNDAVALVHGGVAGNSDGFLLPLTPALGLRSPLVYHGGDDPQTVIRIALNDADEPHVAGNFKGDLRVANKSLTNDETPDAFVVKHTTPTHAPLWIWNTGGSGLEYAYGLAVADDIVYVVGNAINSSGLGIPPGDAADGFLVRLKP